MRDEGGWHYKIYRDFMVNIMPFIILLPLDSVVAKRGLALQTLLPVILESKPGGELIRDPSLTMSRQARRPAVGEVEVHAGLLTCYFMILRMDHGSRLTGGLLAASPG